MGVSVLAQFVGVVVGCCPDPEVGGITTRRVIAGVQHIATDWHRTKGAFIGDPMCADLFPLFIGDDAITFSVSRASP